MIEKKDVIPRSHGEKLIIPEKEDFPPKKVSIAKANLVVYGYVPLRLL